jgi:hypothetical protein
MTGRRRRPAPALVGLLVLATCGPHAGAPHRAGRPRVRESGLPAAPGSGEVHLAAAAHERVLASWLEQAARGAELRLRRVSADGARGQALRVADLSAARSSGFPRLERSGSRIVIAWRDAADPPRLHAALVEP